MRSGASIKKGLAMRQPFFVIPAPPRMDLQFLPGTKRVDFGHWIVKNQGVVSKKG